MFIDAEIKKVGQRYFNSKPVRVNLNSVELIEFEEKEMFIIDGKIDPDGWKKVHRSSCSSYPLQKQTIEYEKKLIKIVTLKKWQKNSMAAPDEYILYFPPEKSEEYIKFKSYLDEQTFNCDMC